MAKTKAKSVRKVDANAARGTAAGPVRKSFAAVLEPDGTALKWVIARVPFEMAKAWPVRKGRRVRGEIEGFAFRTSLFPGRGASEGVVGLGTGTPGTVKLETKGELLLVNKQMQAGAGVRVGDKVRIWLEPDFEEREIKLPKEMERELNAARGLRKWFDAMSPSMRREIGKFVAEPKSAASRQKRAEKLTERLMQAMEGEKEPPPVLRVLFQRQPGAREAWLGLTPAQRRSHLMGIFYYETPEARERRAAKAIEDAVGKAGKKGTRETGKERLRD
jgi:uncharacterized protein YdeI (YjbR/CyaY-like superfamily)